MSILKLRISAVEKIEDADGKFGPQKKILIKDENGRRLSGWVPAKNFVEEDWQTGKSHDLDIWQNGQYWNFKLVGKKEKENDNVMYTINANAKEIKELVENNHKEVMEALRHLYKKVYEISLPTLIKVPNLEFPHNEDAEITFP